MTTVILNWTPAGGPVSTGQLVQYQPLISGGGWITAATVSPTTNTYTITGLLDNTIYEFRIVDDCSYGGPSIGAGPDGVKITCPIVTIGTVTYHSIAYSFPTLGADISKYSVDLLDSTGTSILSNNTTTTTTGTISDSFTGLSATTTYKIRVTVFAGPSYTFNKTCGTVSITTSDAPVCNAPTAITVTLT